MRTSVLALALLLATASLAAAADTRGTTYPLDIPAQSLDDALQALALASQHKLLYDTGLVRGKSSPALKGQFTTEEAVKRLLSGTNLSYEVTGDGLVLIRAAGSPSVSESTASKGVLRLAQAEPAPSESGADTPGERAPEPRLEEITVRGKPFTDANVDIVRTELDPQPYYIFSAQEIARANAGNLGEFLKQRLPMNALAESRSQSAYGEVFSEVNLRGFGTDQTLVLVNGRRTNGSNERQFDINAFSPSMVERIEVLPSSASAIYGGNAVGGVINVILKRDFTGGEVQLTYDTPMDTHAPLYSASAGYGWSLEDGRTNITLSATYRGSGDPLTVGDRPELYERRLQRVLDVPGFKSSDSSPLSAGATPNIASADGSALVFKDDGSPFGGTSLGASTTYVPSGTSPTTSVAQLQAGLLENAGLQNTALAGSAFIDQVWGSSYPVLARPETGSVAGAVRRKMTDRLELIGEVSYNRNEGRMQYLWFPPVLVPSSSPTNPFQQDVLIAPPVDSDFGLQGNEQESLRVVAGFVLDLPWDWRAQGDYTWNRSAGTSRLDFWDAASGGGDWSAAMAEGALNPFVDTLAYPLDIAPFSGADDRWVSRTKARLGDVNLRLSGPIGHLPAGQPNLTVGLGHRQEKRVVNASDYSGYGRFVYVPQSQRVSSVYTEALVPLVAPRNEIPGVRLLDVQLAGRLEDFSVSSDNSYQFTLPPDHDADFGETLPSGKAGYSAFTGALGLRYQPVDSLTVRASYGTAFLPPSFNELIANPPRPAQETGVQDPLRGFERVTAVVLSGGDPGLEPMDAKSWNLGFIFEPQFLPGVRLGLEWFRIQRENLIFIPQDTFMVNNEDRFADRIVRADPESGDPFGVGPITQLDLRALNLGKVSTKGFDVSVGFRHDTERHGLFSLDLLGTIVDSYTAVFAPLDPEEELAGKVYGWNGPLKVRANATFGWERGAWRWSWSAMYYGPYEQYEDPRFIEAHGGATTIPHQIYHDLLVSFEFGPDRAVQGIGAALSDLSLTLGVRNVFDTLPPFDAYYSYEGLYSRFGDPRLRSVQLSVSKRF